METRKAAMILKEQIHWRFLLKVNWKQESQNFLDRGLAKSYF